MGNTLDVSSFPQTLPEAGIDACSAKAGRAVGPRLPRAPKPEFELHMLVIEDSKGGLRQSAGAADEPHCSIKIGENFDEQAAQCLMRGVSEALKSGAGTIYVDMGDVGFLDSAALLALVKAKKLCERSGVRFALSPLSDIAARLIGMSGLTDELGLPRVPRLETRLEPDTRNQQWKAYEYVAVSDPALLADLRNKAIAAAKSAGATGDDLCDIHIAVGEALTNAYRHGSPKKGVNKILLRCLSCRKAIVIEIADEGEPFDPDSVSDPDISLMRDHGMGLFLMRQAMDVVEFTADSPGNRVRMIKWL